MRDRLFSGLAVAVTDAFKAFGRLETIFLVFVLTMLVSLGVLPRHVIPLVTQLLIYCIYALSFFLLYGLSGQFSFGQCIFFGLGAYGVALSTIHLHVDIWAALVVGVVASLAVAFLLGAVLVRQSGPLFIISTLIVSIIFNLVGDAWSQWTGGDEGITFNIGSLPLFFKSVPLTSQTAYMLTSFFCILSLIIIKTITRSRLGLVLSSIRENAERSTCLGYDVRRYKLLAFTLSGTFAGLSGALFAVYGSFATTGYFTLGISVYPILWTLVGGLSVMGPVMGTFVIVTFQYYTDFIWRHSPVILGLLIIIIVKLRFGSFGVLLKWRRG
jgi:branched-chain amino acid transport system permease protein